jgi:cellulose synthase/poly-beta-1,6-N-acetylglucosamine synthase-like glycosyltransferase
MIDILLVPVAIFYLVVVILLFIYGLNFLFLTIKTLTSQNKLQSPPALENWPFVTVQLPIYNELYVAERLINAVARLDYPTDKLEIQVLDDSTDETADLVRKTVEYIRSRGISINILHRKNRDGFKAGALAEGFKSARGEFLAIFDADFVPTPDFLRRAIPYFNNPKIAFVQGRWGHINRGYSPLTFLQSLAIDGHFMVEQFGRFNGNFWFNFNGTAGIWRKQAIEDAGGWKSDTLTEDLDLSYRAFLKGWNAIYLRQVEVPAELPVSFNAYRRQQHRWARGSLECAVKLIPKVWQSKLPVTAKIEATLHLTGYGVHLLMFTLALLYPVAIVLATHYPGITALFGVAVILNITAFTPTLMFLIGQQQLGRKWLRDLPAILFLTVLGTGMTINTMRAAIQIFSGHKMSFERTPKFGIEKKQQNWTHRRYQPRFDTIVFAELAFALWNVQTIWLSIMARDYLIGFYAGLFVLGLTFTAGISIAQAVVIHHRQLKTIESEG